MKHRFHLLGLAHLPQSRKYMSCAFTQKNVKLASMLMALGHKVYFYGSEDSQVPCTKFIQTHTLADIRNDYGDGNNLFPIGYDWTNTDFRHDFTGPKKQSTIKFYLTCITEINKNKKDDDFLLCTQGEYHKPIADAVKLFLTCESGIGYRGSVKEWYRAFESSFIQNYTYGYENNLACANGSYYDRVIPNYFDSHDIEYSEKKDNYYLFIGRMIERKGIVTAYEATKAIGAKLIIAGQGGIVLPNGTLTATDDPDFEIPPGNWEYVGYADVNKRKSLMAHAIATFTPSIYMEIFGGTHVESMLSGTPVITTNFGVYPGTIPDCMEGIVGFRCNTLADFADAAIKCVTLDPKPIRKYAERFLMDRVMLDYERWFSDLYRVYESTKNDSKKAWHWLPARKTIDNDD
jgi:glycosyltransferase involved in cell wall biosynthesis